MGLGVICAFIIAPEPVSVSIMSSGNSDTSKTLSITGFGGITFNILPCSSTNILYGFPTLSVTVSVSLYPLPGFTTTTWSTVNAPWLVSTKG